MSVGGDIAGGFVVLRSLNQVCIHPTLPERERERERRESETSAMHFRYNFKFNIFIVVILVTLYRCELMDMYVTMDYINTSYTQTTKLQQDGYVCYKSFCQYI